MIIKDHLHTVMCRLGFPSREDHMQQKADHQNERTDCNWFALNRDEFGACYLAIVKEEQDGRMSQMRHRRLIALLQLFVREAQNAER